jgi:hypothetical protein
MNRILGIGSELGAGGIPALRSAPEQARLGRTLGSLSIRALGSSRAKNAAGLPPMYVGSWCGTFAPKQHCGWWQRLNHEKRTIPDLKILR